jgi:hypothetical protein
MESVNPMANFSLDDIRAAAEKKYGATVIDLGGETITLLNPLRVSKENREELLALEREDDLDVEDSTKRALELMVKSPGDYKRLISHFGGDLGMLATIMETHTASAQVGEASASQD